ncbi:hypothetical protein [Lunatibacter salilacus]|uniref:hypothetical protein n=1 Tax=Lunatibacter salilacus TaxID=2483804 RepID=UPI00131B3979|nr:hypothetical protein [Lunatibacter salilacus]
MIRSLPGAPLPLHPWLLRLHPYGAGIQNQPKNQTTHQPTTYIPIRQKAKPDISMFRRERLTSSTITAAKSKPSFCNQVG